MATIRKKGSHTGKDKKKNAGFAKGGKKQKAKDDVCVLNEVVMTERLFCCESDCCC